jgi:hypothetical protein
MIILGSDGRPHEIDPARVDQFLSGKTGQPVNDEQWDESQRRLRGEVPPATIPGEIRYPTDEQYAAGDRA